MLKYAFHSILTAPFAPSWPLETLVLFVLFGGDMLSGLQITNPGYKWYWKPENNVTPQITSRMSLTYAKPFNWLAAAKPCPISTKSRRRNCGLRLAPLSGMQPLTFATILRFFGKSTGLGGVIYTHDVTLFVVGASKGSLTITPSPTGNIFLLREWLIMYEWSATDKGPLIRSTLHGKFGSVTLKGVSQIYTNMNLLRNLDTCKIKLTIWNSGKMKSTWDESAPLSRKTTTLFPLSIISPRVGHSEFAIGTCGGT